MTNQILNNPLKRLLLLHQLIVPLQPVLQHRVRRLRDAV